MLIGPNYFINTRGEELNWLRMFEVIGFIVIIIGLVLFWVFAIFRRYPLAEIYPIYIVWGIGVLLFFVMRHYRRNQ